MMFNQSDDPTQTPGQPLGGLRKLSIKFQGQKPATTDPMTGQQTPATGPDHGLAEISLESHPPDNGKMSKEAAPTPEQFGGGTKLDPLAEALFPHWMRANGMDPEDIQDHTFDYRGTYMQTNGQVHPPGHLAGVADKINALHQRLAQPLPNATATPDQGLDPLQQLRQLVQSQKGPFNGGGIQ